MDDKRPTKDHASAAVPLPPSERSHVPQKNEQLQKEWEHLPAVHMSADLRARVEDVIKKESLVYKPVRVLPLSLPFFFQSVSFLDLNGMKLEPKGAVPQSA